jgi:hypothetical protein
VRRVVVILLALVLVPSVTAAPWYRCEVDRATRAACCCPTEQDRQPQNTPAQDASIRAASCCTVTQDTTAVPTIRASQPTSIDVHPPALAVVFTVVPPRAPGKVGLLDRPRAQGDPPASLYARRCSLLL